MTHRLEGAPREAWGNIILFRLAEALGYPRHFEGSVKRPEVMYVVDPDELLDQACETIWKYQDLRDS